MTRRGRSRAASPPIALDLRRRPFIGLDRLGEIRLDVRPQHLDRDLPALGGDGAVDLGDRGGADRLGIDLGEERSRSAAPSPCSIAALIASNGAGGRLSCSSSEVARRLLADQIGPGRQRLAELDRGRADRLEGGGIVGHVAARARRSGRAGTAGAPAAACSDRARCRAARRAAPAPGPISEAARHGRRRRSNLPAAMDRDQAAEDRLGLHVARSPPPRSSP